MFWIECILNFESLNLIAQLVECGTLDRKVVGFESRLVRGVESLSKILHPNCLVLVKLRKPSQHD